MDNGKRKLKHFARSSLERLLMTKPSDSDCSTRFLWSSIETVWYHQHFFRPPNFWNAFPKKESAFSGKYCLSSCKYRFFQIKNFSDFSPKYINKNGTRRAQIPRKPLIFPSPNKQTNRRTNKKFCPHRGSNSRPSRFLHNALTDWAIGPYSSDYYYEITIIRLLLSD